MGKGAGESVLSTQHAQYKASLDLAAHIKTVEDCRPADAYGSLAHEGKLADLFLFNPDSPDRFDVEAQFAPDAASHHTLGDLALFRSDSPPLNLDDFLYAEAYPNTWAPLPVVSEDSPILNDRLLHNILFKNEPAAEAVTPLPTTPDMAELVHAPDMLYPDTPFATAQLAPAFLEPAALAAPGPVPHQLHSQEEVLQHLPAIPCSIATDDGTEVSFASTLWRRPQPPHGAMVNVRVTALAAARPEQQATTFYCAISPRIITTGYCPYARPAAAAAPAHHHTRRAHRGSQADDAGSGGLTRQASAGARTSSGNFSLEEMWVLKRSPSALAEVEDSYHFEGPFTSSAVPDMPAWPGSWKIDLVARLADSDGSSFWVKSLHRDMAAYDGT